MTTAVDDWELTPDDFDGFVADTFELHPDLLRTPQEQNLSDQEILAFVAMVVSDDWDLWVFESDPDIVGLHLDALVIAAVKRYLTAHHGFQFPAVTENSSPAEDGV